MKKRILLAAMALTWVLPAAARVAGFIVGLDADAYAADELRSSAVERQLEIIGEALSWRDFSLSS